MHIVLVEDDEVIRETTQISLERFGYTVSAFEDGRDGYEFVADHGADVVLLDLMLPTMNGASICRAIRERSTTPIIIISARSEPIDIVQALEAGADDYLTKPFDMQVLNARIRAVVRRFITAGTGRMGFSPDEVDAGAAEPTLGASGMIDTDGIPEVLGPSPGLAPPRASGAPASPQAGTPAGYPARPAQRPSAGAPAPGAAPDRAGSPAREELGPYRTQLGSLVLDTGRLTVMVDGAEVHLTPTELRVLLLLTEEPGHVYSREKIAYTVWGYEWAGDSRVVDVHIQRLRKKIGARMIETVRGFGYRFAG
ncbi:response regulator transcription factor [Brevibacterium ihuae]|uniref:response regulator transcription factor n=1 Tax=Brevibacterium ihuae TaxID=1631743 RepID=UPI000C778D33|nr:response regulator transcription factor [Brevibacterium ihuae]